MSEVRSDVYSPPHALSGAAHIANMSTREKQVAEAQTHRSAGDAARWREFAERN